MPLPHEDFSQLLSRSKQLVEDYQHIASMSEEQFAQYCSVLHESHAALKQSLFVSNFRNQQDADRFEYAFGAQSTQFVIDMIPYIHEIMVRHYNRFDALSLIDVGPGSCIGTNLLVALHSDHIVYSKLNVSAIDYTDLRERWVRALYPKIDYQVGDVFDLAEMAWDFVVCSHVIEHLEQPRPFIEQLMKICKGFAFVYSPFEETDRIPHHLSTISRQTYQGIEKCRLEVIKSMGWRGDVPGEYCLLAIIDCRR